MSEFTLHHGDCLDIMRTMPERSIDAVVTDPPYGLEFMGKEWDKLDIRQPGDANYPIGTGAYGRAKVRHASAPSYGGAVGPSIQAWHLAWATEAIRVAKPGAYLLAFGGTRTFHRLASAIEDAGWEIRDCIMWVYGSGFPKSHNLDGQWDGWGTALKPAWEPIIVARKPLEGTVAKNVEKYGTGAMNIDSARIPTEEALVHGGPLVTNSGDTRKGKALGMFQEGTPNTYEQNALGRWPANVIHDGSEEALGLFPDTAPSKIGKPRGTAKKGLFANSDFNKVGTEHNDSGSAARFFYCAKADKSDRDEGLEGMPEKEVAYSEYREAMKDTDSYVSKYPDGTPRPMNRQRNNHPTVKPTSLMRYLCRLITPPKGTVFDPFTGSGSTGKAAMIEGFNFVGCEKEHEYVEIARARIKAAAAQMQLPW